MYGGGRSPGACEEFCMLAIIFRYEHSNVRERIYLRFSGHGPEFKVEIVFVSGGLGDFGATFHGCNCTAQPM